MRNGLFPASCIRTSPNPVRLKVAKGQYVGRRRTELHLETEFLNHEELSQPDKGKRVTFTGTFYEENTDWGIFIGYDFMAATDTGVQLAQSSMTLYKDDCLSWLSAHLAFEESHGAHANANSFAAPYEQSIHAKGRSRNMVLLPKPSMRPLPDLEQASHRWMHSALLTLKVFNYARHIGMARSPHGSSGAMSIFGDCYGFAATQDVCPAPLQKLSPTEPRPCLC